MNIEIANRLVNLRKEKGLSQEELASQLGISRQAVSKWERAEASPDTDNLIELAKLYDMSLDALLYTDQEQFESGGNDESQNDGEEPKEKPKDTVHISLREGIHVKDKEGSEVHVGWNGIHVKDNSEDDDKNNVDIDGDGVFVDGKQYTKEDFISKPTFPFGIIIVMAYLFIGIFYNMWHPWWLLIFLIPIFESCIKAIKQRDISKIEYPVIVAVIFFCAGFEYDLWHPMWAVFLTVPVFYAITGYFKDRKKYKEKQENKED